MLSIGCESGTLGGQPADGPPVQTESNHEPAAGTILVAAALHFESGPKIDPILSAPIMPGFFLAMLLGVRGGPDGMPNILYVFGLSFVLWWIAIDLVWCVCRWVATPLMARYAKCTLYRSTVLLRSRMQRRVRAVAIFVLALAFPSAAAAEEQAEGYSARSFNALQPWLTRGERLIISDSSGRKTHWRFVSLSGDQLETKRRRWNFRSERRTWPEGTVQRIEHEDSRLEGGVIGAAVGVAAAVIMNKSPRCDERCLPLIYAAVPVGMVIGEAIDGSINLTLYESPLVSRFGVAPAPGFHRGVVLSYRLSLAR